MCNIHEFIHYYQLKIIKHTKSVKLRKIQNIKFELYTVLLQWEFVKLRLGYS